MRRIFCFLERKIEFIIFGVPVIIFLIASLIFFIRSFQNKVDLFPTIFCFLGSVVLWVIYRSNRKNIRKDYSSQEHRYWYFTVSLGGMLSVLITLEALRLGALMKVFPILYGGENFVDIELLLRYLPIYFQTLMFLLAIVAFVLAYLNFSRKHGATLSGNFIFDISNQEVMYIKEINVYNEKDRVTSVFSINCILNKKIKIRIIDYGNSPLILQAFSLEKIELLAVFKYSNLKKNPDFSLKTIKLEFLTDAGAVILYDKVFDMAVESKALRLPRELSNIRLDTTHLATFLDIDNPIPLKLAGNHLLITCVCDEDKIRCLEKIKLPQTLVDKLNKNEDISFELKGLYIKQIGILKKGSYSHGIDPEFIKITSLTLSNGFY